MVFYHDFGVDFFLIREIDVNAFTAFYEESTTTSKGGLERKADQNGFAPPRPVVNRWNPYDQYKFLMMMMMMTMF